MKATVTVALILTLVVPLDLFAQTKRPPGTTHAPIQCDVCTANGLSQAVVLGTFAALSELQAELKTGTARSADVQQTLATVRIFFAHLDETGITKAVEQSILTREEDLIRYTPNRLDAEHVQKRHEALGLRTTADEHLRNMEALTVNDRMHFVAAIKDGGMHSYYAHVISRLESLGDKVAKAEKSRARIILVQAPGQSLPPDSFDRWYQDHPAIGNGPCYYKAIAAALGIACVFGCTGCCVVAAFAKLAEATDPAC